MVIHSAVVTRMPSGGVREPRLPAFRDGRPHQGSCVCGYVSSLQALARKTEAAGHEDHRQPWAGVARAPSLRPIPCYSRVRGRRTRVRPHPRQSGPVVGNHILTPDGMSTIHRENGWRYCYRWARRRPRRDAGLWHRHPYDPLSRS